jgi:DNA-binding MarR family transcriptional regulator
MAVAIQDLARAIKRVQHRHHRALDSRLVAAGTTLVQWDALRHIARHPDSSSHRLALLTFQSDQSFGTLATRLIERGLITRETGGGRAFRHRLTPAGTRVLETGQVVFDEVIADAFAPLSATDRDALYTLLMRLLPAAADGEDEDDDEVAPSTRGPRPTPRRG